MSSRSYEPGPELEPEQARVDIPEFSATTSDVAEDNQIEINLESPICNVNAQQGRKNPLQKRETKKMWGGKEDRLSLRLALYKAALRGDRNAAKRALILDSNAACLRITVRGDMPLHIAALARQTEFVR
ncbi:40S ribosomal protein S14 [Olea europaea subsp. europaea]|uniref:40S ribosomal protein S14 n=1 Tax=Olea europaea subsp. europaea TaxID=158383 RepID=A0A8S0SW17_OLEEU|nr:40S ribosomal protein S14 [Olea europaea subsp. europaea]